MRGMIEPVTIDLDDVTFLAEANVAAAKGQEFLLMRNPEGGMTGINVRNILTFEDVGEDADILR
jgi:hypothetical protein